MPITMELPIRTRTTADETPIDTPMVDESLKNLFFEIPSDEKRCKYLFFRTTCNDEFKPPFCDLTSVQCSVGMMKSFENIYINEVEYLERFDLSLPPFPTNPSRPEGLAYINEAIAMLQFKHDPGLADLQSLPTVDDADADAIFREITEQAAPEEAQMEANLLWTEIYFEYKLKRERVDNEWRGRWYGELEALVNEYCAAFSGLIEEEQKVFLAAFEVADPEKPVPLNWIAVLGPRDSSVYALAHSAFSS